MGLVFDLVKLAQQSFHSFALFAAGIVKCMAGAVQ
jgi:hypothetical protein